MPSRTQLAAMAAAITAPPVPSLTTESYRTDDLPGYPTVPVSTSVGWVRVRLCAGNRGWIESGSVCRGGTYYDLRINVECADGRWRLAADSSDPFHRRALGVYYASAPHRDVPETRARAIRHEVGGAVTAWLDAHPAVAAYAAQVRLLHELTDTQQKIDALLPELRALRAARDAAIAHGGCVPLNDEEDEGRDAA